MKREAIKTFLIRLQTLQLLTFVVMLYSPPSGLTVTGVRLVSVLQCSCIQLLSGAAHSSTLNTETSIESTHTLTQRGIRPATNNYCQCRLPIIITIG